MIPILKIKRKAKPMKEKKRELTSNIGKVGKSNTSKIKVTKVAKRTIKHMEIALGGLELPTIFNL
jgi:hypothetical protein